MPVATEQEGHYLCAILNSDVVADRIGKLQSRGLFGTRDIDMLPWRLPIPRYDGDVPAHSELSALGARAAREAAALPLDDGMAFTAARSAVRAALNANGTTALIEEAVSLLLDAPA
jgi:hypothetical protein